MAESPQPQQSPERELAEVLVAGLERRERRTARDLLLSEHRGLVRMRKAVRRANAAVVATAVATDDERDTLQHVWRASATLQTDLHAAARLSLSDARASGRSALEREVGRELPALAVAAEDDAIAAAAGQTLAGGWASTTLSTIATRGETSLARAVAGVPELVDPRLRRTAATEVARSYNDERNELLVDLDQILRNEGGEPGDPKGPAGRPVVGLYKIRSEILDRVTCQDCFAADGETVEAHQSFKSGTPPVHPHCRGIVEHIIISKPERLEDISIDYEALKAEIQDVIRERREVSDRHALAFTSDSLGSKRSAEVLTRRFRDEAYASNGPTAAGGRVKLVTPTPTGGGSGGGAPPAPPPRGPSGGGGGNGNGNGGERKPLTFVSHLTPDIVAELGAVPNGDIEAASKAIFGGRVPDAESWRRLWDPPSGYNLHFRSFTAEDDHLRVSGTLRTSTGDKAADVVRYFKREGAELIAKHELLIIEDAYQGKGIGEALTRSALRGYREMNIDRVLVDAHWTGRYTWARFGFSWPPQNAEHWRSRLERFLHAETGDRARAELLSRTALTGAHAVADLELNGERLGKKFLLDKHFVPHWEGELRLQDGDVGFEYAKKRLKL